MDRLNLLRENLNQINGWIENSDTKISILLGIELVTIGWTLDRASEILRFYQKLPEGQKGYLIILAGWFILSAGVSLWHGYGTLRPRLDLPKESTHSLFYYGTIASLALGAYKQKMGELEESQTFDELAEQVWVNAKIAHAKFESVRASVTSYFFGLIGILVLLLWMVLSNGAS